MLFNVICNLIVIPRYGVQGAAWATLLSQVLATYFFDLLYYRTRKIFVMKTKALFLWGIIESIRPSELLQRYKENN